jgi:FAD:protein FMN transferase
MNFPDMNRRRFLNPRHLARAAGSVVAAVEEVSSLYLADPPQQECAFLRFGHRAMATDWAFLVPFGTPDAMDLAEQAFITVDSLEDQLSVYRDHSEISRLNRDAFTNPVQVEERLFGLLQLAARLTHETEGAFDITAGALIKAWGFFRGPKRVPIAIERKQALERVGMKHVELNPDTMSVRFVRGGLEINLGAIGKGYAIDRAIETLRAKSGVRAALLHGGQSSVYAIGSEPATDRGWLIELGHPLATERCLGTIRLRDQGLGTSASTFRNLEFGGRRLGHILDPRVGWPAEGMASVTVIAPTATVADALATAFFILGTDKAEHYCEQHPEIGAILLAEGEERPRVFGALKSVFSPACSAPSQQVQDA